MNKTYKRYRHTTQMSKPRFVISVALYYLLLHIRGICSFGGFGLLGLGLTLLYIDLPAAICLCSIGCCLITTRLVIGRTEK